MKKLKYFFVLFVCALSISAFANEKIKCHKEATSIIGLGLDKDQAIKLCRGAKNARDIVDCHKEATSPFGLELDKDQAIRLCQPIIEK